MFPVDYIAQGFMLEKNLHGYLGICIAPGRNNKNLGPTYGRDLGRDLVSLRLDHDTRALVSLLEDYEYDMLGMHGIEQNIDVISKLHSVGYDGDMEYIRFPIPDVSIPYRGMEKEFDTLVEILYNYLKEDQTVIIHCRGGKGRSGTLAACVLTRIGYEPKISIKIVRDVRPGAIETRAQENYVYKYALRRNLHDQEQIT